MRMTAALPIITCALVGCTPPAPSYKVTDPKTGEKTNVSIDDKAGDKTITVKTKEGTASISVAESGEVPQNLPAYIPLYPGAKYTGSLATSADEKVENKLILSGTLSFSTKDSNAKVLAFYKNAFIRAGLADTGMGSPEMISFVIGDNEVDGAQVLARSTPNGETQVQVIYSQFR